MIEDRKDRLINETIIVALLTAVAYASSFCFQYSFLHYFGLPSYFIEFDVMNVVFTLLVVFLSMIIFYLCIFPLVYSFKNDSNKKSIIFYYTLYYIPALLILVILYDLDKSKSFNVVLAILFLLFWTAQIIFLKRKIKKINNGLEKDPGYLDRISKRYGLIPISLFYITIFFVIGSYIAGESIARNQEEYLVFETTESPFAVIKPYGEGFLAVSFDREAKTFNRKIRVTSESDFSSKEIKILREHIGPLNNGSYYIENNIFFTFIRRFTKWTEGRLEKVHKFPNLGGGYRIDYNNEDGLVILDPENKHIVEHVLHFNFDSRFIIVDKREQDNIAECNGYISSSTLKRCNEALKLNTTKSFFIIDKETHNLYGPINKESYLKERIKLGVSDSLILLP